jgi:hypothetical protein
MGDVLIAGIPASLVIVSLVQAAKTLGMQRKFSPLLSIALGIALMMSVQVVQVLPWLRAWWEAMGAGVMLGLSACGLYSGGKAMIMSHASGRRYRETEVGDVVPGTVVHAEAKSAPVSVHEDPPQIGPGDGRHS